MAAELDLWTRYLVGIASLEQGNAVYAQYGGASKGTDAEMYRDASSLIYRDIGRMRRLKRGYGNKRSAESKFAAWFLQGRKQDRKKENQEWLDNYFYPAAD